jgi:hypothetical protein
MQLQVGALVRRAAAALMVAVGLASCTTGQDSIPSPQPSSTPNGSNGVDGSGAVAITDLDSFVAALSSEVKVHDRGSKAFLTRELGVPGQELNAGGHLYAYEFPSMAALNGFRDGVSPDGSMLPIPGGKGSIIVEWSAPRLYGEVESSSSISATTDPRLRRSET